MESRKRGIEGQALSVPMFLVRFVCTSELRLARRDPRFPSGRATLVQRRSQRHLRTRHPRHACLPASRFPATNTLTTGSQMVHDLMPPQSRLSCPVTYKCDRFKVQRRDFRQQYDKFYNARYNQMYEWVRESALKRWGTDISLIHLSDLMDRRGETVLVIGSLLKVMKLHPSVLREVSEDLELVPEAPLDRFTSDNDHLSLQEPGENVMLVSGIDVATHVTGIMVCVKGHEHDNGNKFIVEDFCYPTPCPQKPLVLASEDMYILFVSDLAFALNSDPKVEQARNNLLAFLSGTDDEETNRTSSRIVRVIIAGNCMDEGAAEQEKELEVLEKTEDEDEWNKKERSYTIETLALIDDYLSTMGASVSVDVMSGPFDMTSYLVPQQAMHPLNLPKSARVKTVKCTTNPYDAQFGEVGVLGSCGRVANSIREMTTMDEAVEILDQTITWRHMIPTAPDSVPAYPFLDVDPFVMEERPHVYFVGNQKEFNTKVSEGDGKKTRIISVPSFKLTQTCVMLNLRTLACDVLAFNA